MNKHLVFLSKQILSHYSKGLSKVRFAKLIYLIHKGLVQLNLSDKDSLEFIRMPLGPVPNEFKLLSGVDGIIIEEMAVGLSYNKQNYTLSNDENIMPNVSISKLLKKLDNIQTNELIAYTHQEPSWLSHANGQLYKLELNDLNRPLPEKNFTTVNDEIDDQKIQALLIHGMIDDIVEESTALEYPNQREE